MDIGQMVINVIKYQYYVNNIMYKMVDVNHV